MRICATHVKKCCMKMGMKQWPSSASSSFPEARDLIDLHLIDLQKASGNMNLNDMERSQTLGELLLTQ